MSLRPKILIVDDERRMCDSLKELLSYQGYETQTSCNGREAIECLAMNTFDLVLLDIVMPDMSGHEIMDHINSKCPDTFIIVITGHASSDSAIDSLKKGAFDYLRKPFEHEELTKAVKNALDHIVLKSEQKRVEQALWESEEKYKTLVESSVTGIFIHQDGKYEFVNGKFAEIHGYKPEELVGKEYLGLIHPDERDAFAQIASARLKGEAVSQQYEVRKLRKDGTTIWCEMMAARIEYGGRPAIMGHIIDITSRKRAEERIKRLNLLKEELLGSGTLKEKLERVTDGVVEIFDADFCRIWITKDGDLCDSGCFHAKVTEGPHFCRYRDRCLHLVASSGRYTHTDGGHRRVPFGCYKIGRVASAEDTKFLTNDVTNDPRVHDKDWARNLGLVSFAGYRLLSEAGKSIGVLALFSKHAIFREEDALIEGLANTTAQVIQMARAGEALVQAKEHWENTFDAITDMIMLLDNEHQIIRVNKATAEALNIAKEGLVGKKCYEAVHGQRRRIGHCPLALTIKTLKPQTTEITEPKLGGTFICSTSPVVNREGELAGYIHTLKDITESKRLEAQFQQAQRLEAVGTLAGGIAHEFNNALVGVSGNIELLQMDLPNGENVDKYVERTKDSTRRMVRLTNQLLAYARGGKYQPKIISLKDIVEDTVPLIQHDIDSTVRVETDLPGDISHVEADPTQIQMVLSAVLNNAAEAIEGEGRIRIITRDEKIDKEIAEADPHLKPGSYVSLTIEDDGKGMDQETISRVFDPFFTTKYQGRGMGMAAAYGIIKNHGGSISIDSELGKGTVAQIYLPAVAVQVKQSKETKGESVLC